MALCDFGFTPDLVDVGDTFTYHACSLSSGHIFYLTQPKNWLCVMTLPSGSLVSLYEPSADDDRVQVVRCRLQQDVVGGRTLAGWSPGTIVWAAGSAPTVPSTANAFVNVRFLWLGTTLGWLGEVF